jgi:hypothetical protein
VSPDARDEPGQRAYLELQKRAKATGRNTQELLDLYTLEGFLARLAVSDARDDFILKGGVLLAAFGNRRPTRDVDLAALHISNAPASVLSQIVEVCDAVVPIDDGVRFSTASVTADVIRDEDEYSGVRVSVDARIGKARIRFHVDVNIGDPIVPGPDVVSVPRLLGGDPIEVRGYPLHMVLAEKLVTAVQRGVANTRWRDFGDIWTLTRGHAVSGSDLQDAIYEVAAHRRVDIASLADVLEGYADLAQPKWDAWRRRHIRDDLPAQFHRVTESVIEFADPVLTGDVSERIWDPDRTAWT